MRQHQKGTLGKATADVCKNGNQADGGQRVKHLPGTTLLVLG